MNLFSLSKSKGMRPKFEILVLLVFLLGILGFLFKDIFKPETVLFANDGPLGVLKSNALKTPDAITGFWMDLYWVGINGTALPLGVSNLLLWWLGPIGFAKFYGPTTLLILGVCAWMFFRTLQLPRGM